MRPAVILVIGAAASATLLAVLTYLLIGSVSILLGAATVNAILAILALLSFKRMCPSHPISPIEVLYSHTTLEFLDAEGHVAHYAKRQKCVARAKGIHSYIEAGLSADGPIEGITTSPGTHVRKMPLGSGERSIFEVVFEDPPRPGARIDRLLECRFMDSFKTSDEYFGLTIGHLAREIVFEVIAHRDRPFKTAWLIYMSQDAVIRFPDKALELIRNPQGKIMAARYRIVRPALGSRYRICWTW